MKHTGFLLCFLCLTGADRVRMTMGADCRGGAYLMICVLVALLAIFRPLQVWGLLCLVHLAISPRSLHGQTPSSDFAGEAAISLAGSTRVAGGCQPGRALRFRAAAPRSSVIRAPNKQTIDPLRRLLNLRADIFLSCSEGTSRVNRRSATREGQC